MQQFDTVRLGSNIRYWRLTRGIRTLHELGKKCKYSETYLGQIERGVKEPSLTTLARVAGNLGVTVADLMDGCVKEG